MTESTLLDYQVYSDHVHAVHLPHRAHTLSRQPATVVNAAEQHAWHESRENVVRRELTALNCEETVVVFGVTVQRSDAYTRVTSTSTTARQRRASSCATRWRKPSARSSRWRAKAGWQGEQT